MDTVRRSLMEPRIASSRPDVVTVESAPRPTPKPARVDFHEVLARTLVRGAEAAVRSLPGAPIMAVAVRGAPGSPAALATPMSGSAAGARVTMVPEGPGALGGSGLVGAGATTSAGDGGIESSLAQSQELNLYFLQIQQEVNAQNQQFSALSNVLKTEHDTVKNAIGNIR
jgi:hypothetical protein